jgi:hypothetical protein
MVLFSPAYLCLRGVLHPDPLVGEVTRVEFLANINAPKHVDSVIKTVPDRIGLKLLNIVLLGTYHIIC